MPPPFTRRFQVAGPTTPSMTRSSRDDWYRRTPSSVPGPNEPSAVDVPMEKPLASRMFWSTLTQLPVSPYRNVGRLDTGVEDEHDCTAAAASGGGAATRSPAA